VGIVILNLIIGFAFGGFIDNWAHIGGLVTGLVLGALFTPSRVPTMRSMWLRPGQTPGTTVPVFGSGGTRAVQVAGLAVLAIGFGVLWTIGVSAWG
jgi:hypothetical protein